MSFESRIPTASALGVCQIRHRHVFTEYKFDGSVLRNHILNVRVFAVSAIDPNDPEQVKDRQRVSECTFISDESTQMDGRKIPFKWQCLKAAFKNNPFVAKMNEYVAPVTGTTWRFIECSRNPVTFQEDNLTNIVGFNSVLAADLLPLVFVIGGEFQISTSVQ